MPGEPLPQNPLRDDIPPEHERRFAEAQAEIDAGWRQFGEPRPRPRADIKAEEVVEWLKARPGISWQATIADVEKAIAELRGAVPKKTGETKAVPHHYSPSVMHMGDCAICGNVEDVPWHISRDKLPIPLDLWREIDAAWRSAGLPEEFLGNGGTNHRLYAFVEKALSATAAKVADEYAERWRKQQAEWEAQTPPSPTKQVMIMAARERAEAAEAIAAQIRGGLAGPGVYGITFPGLKNAKITNITSSEYHFDHSEPKE